MKLTLLTLMMGVNGLMAFYSPKMRANFGANHAVLRIDAGYYSYLCPRPSVVRTDGGTVASDGHNHQVWSAMTLNAEAMVMVNNRYGFTESLGRRRPTFVHGKVNYDGFTNTSLASFSYAHSTTCKTNFLFFGQVRGYLSAGLAIRTNGTQTFPKGAEYNNMGARFGYNVYNENSALQFETYVFHDKVVISSMAHRKVGGSVLISGGVDNNRPKAGFSVMMGKGCRMSASARMQDVKCLQAGMNVAFNF